MCVETGDGAGGTDGAVSGTFAPCRESAPTDTLDHAGRRKDTGAGRAWTKRAPGVRIMTQLQDRPDELRSLVYDVVADGSWTTADVVASVATDSVADRADVVATLWDLVDDGALRYDCNAGLPGFRPA